MGDHLPLGRMTDALTEEERRHVESCETCREGVAAALATTVTLSVGPDGLGRPADSPATPPPLTTEDGHRYTYLRELGAGGMGRVDLVEDRHLRRQVAYKQLVGSAAPERFLREAMITSHLEHPGIAPVYDLGIRADGRPYYTMRRIEGQTLTQALQGRRGLDDRLKLLGAFASVCHTLGYAHARGVVHRDLKPDNVMIAGHGSTVVLDWGLARVTGEATAQAVASGDPRAHGLLHTRAGTVLGTIPYMSPEQARGGADAADARSDVWSLGTILYEILAGRRAFPGSDAARLLMDVRRGHVDPVTTVSPGVPPPLASIVAKALSPAPVDRYATARDLADDIESWRIGGLVAAHRYDPFERARVEAAGAGDAVSEALLVDPTWSVGRQWAAHLGRNFRWLWFTRRGSLLTVAAAFGGVGPALWGVFGYWTSETLWLWLLVVYAATLFAAQSFVGWDAPMIRRERDNGANMTTSIAAKTTLLVVLTALGSLGSAAACVVVFDRSAELKLSVGALGITAALHCAGAAGMAVGLGFSALPLGRSRGGRPRPGPRPHAGGAGDQSRPAPDPRP